MKQKRKNRFFTFIFSFLSGAAEMYMGFMKNGLTLMMLFFLPLIPMFFIGSLEFLGFAGVIIWFYGFFHARNYAGMSDEEFLSMDDHYIWDEFGDVRAKTVFIQGRTVRKWVAAILIFIGAAQLWNYFFESMVRLIPESYWDYIYPFLRELPQVAIAIFFIIVGVRMILGKKNELVETADTEGRLIAELPQKKESENVSETKEA